MPVVTRRVDKKSAGPGWWSDKERYQAVATYLVVGKYSLTAAATGIPEETLRRWKNTEWWKEAADEISRSSKIELNGKISNVINKSLAVLGDRLENGDFFYNPKTGSFERKQIPASVANRIANDLISKSILLDKEIQTERQTDEGLDDRLKKLKEEMLRFAGAKTIEGTHELLSTSNEPVQQEEGTGNESDQPSVTEGPGTPIPEDGASEDSPGSDPSSTDPGPINHYS